MNPSSVPLRSLGEPRSARLDLCAAGLPVLCLLHCLALPLLATLMPLAVQAVEGELTHRILAVVAVPLSLRVVWKTLSDGGSRLFVGAALIGLGLLLLAAFVEALSAHEELITVVGGALLCAAHLWHWMQQRTKPALNGRLVEADGT